MRNNVKFRKIFLEERIASIKQKLQNGEMTLKKRVKNGWSPVWATFEEIFEKETKETHFVSCSLCKGIVNKPDSNTNTMRRHRCMKEKAKKKFNVLPEDRTGVKVAAAKYCIKDMRPAWSVELDGLLDLCTECMHFGQKYRKATREDLADTFPCRNTVTNTVDEIAGDNREQISALIKAAIESGGIAASVDGWQDDFRKLYYLGVVAHLTIGTGDNIIQHRIVLSTNEIDELVKTGTVKTFIQQCFLKILFNKWFLLFQIKS